MTDTEPPLLPTRRETALNAAIQLRDIIYRLIWKLHAAAAPAELQQRQNELMGRLYNPVLGERIDGRHGPVAEQHRGEPIGLWSRGSCQPWPAATPPVSWPARTASPPVPKR